MILTKRRRMNRSLGGDLAIGLLVGLMGIVMVLPLVYAISNSLKPLNELWIFPPRFFVRNPTFKNFTSLFSLMSDSWVPFSRYIFNTLFVAVAGTAGHVILSSLCAYALSKHDFYGRVFLFKVIEKALMFSTAVLAIPTYLVMLRMHLIDTYASLILPAFALPLGLYLMKQFLDAMVPFSLLESARMDGAGEWRVFWKIVMPIAKPAWLTLIVFSFKDLWNSGGAGGSTYIYAEELKTLNYTIGQITAGGVARAGTAAAASVFMMILPIAVFIITQSNVIETMATSGMKD